MKKTDKNLTTIYIVRHGQTEHNVLQLMQGHNDSPLTHLGEQQARSLAQEFKHIHFDEVFSSDLLRAKRTAELITLERKLAIKTTDALRERFYGKYEGRPYAEYNQALQELLLNYKDASDEVLFKLQIAGEVESKEEAVIRFITFLRELAVGYAGKTLLIVSHGGVMRYFLYKVGFVTEKNLSPGKIENGAYIKLESDGVDFFVKETKGIEMKISNS